MNWQLLLMAVFNAGIEIANRRRVAEGQPPLTDTQVAEEKARAFAGAYGDINAWFDETGRPRPV